MRSLCKNYLSKITKYKKKKAIHLKEGRYLKGNQCFRNGNAILDTTNKWNISQHLVDFLYYSLFIFSIIYPSARRKPGSFAFSMDNVELNFALANS